MKKFFKNEEAITLIALIVTIIVLLILAGITITALSGENGILTKSSIAKLSTEQAQILEQLRLELYEKKLNIENKLTEINYLKERGIINNEVTDIGKLGNYASLRDPIKISATYVESSNVYYIINTTKLIDNASTGKGNWENGDIYYILDGDLYYMAENKDNQIIGKLFEEKTTEKIKWLYQEKDENIEIIGMDLSDFNYNLGTYTLEILLEIDSLTVPSQINGKNVTRVSFEQSIFPIDSFDFDCTIIIKNVKKLSFGDTIEVLDTSSLLFLDLIELHLPNNLTTIEAKSFYEYLKLNEITISNNVTTIGDWAFKYVNTLNFPNGKNDALIIPENKWGAHKIFINGTEYNP